MNLMKRSRTIGIAVAAAIGSAVPAMAGSALPSVAMQWSGLYVGGDIGGAWSDSDWRYDNPNYFNTLGSTLLGTKFGFNSAGVLGGGHIGYNLQSGAWVFGVEGSVDGADLDDTRSSPFFPTLDRYTVKTDLLTSVTGRAGFASGRWLIYGKAGWAGADVSLDLLDTVLGVHASGSRWVNGWTAGGGIGYALNRQLSLGLEYDFTDLATDNWTVHCPACGTGVGLGTPVVNGDITVQAVTARLDYRFGG
jgi:outer membrane immunogenic protein